MTGDRSALSHRCLFFIAQHYDWGLRAMKTCLNTGGKLIQELKQRAVTLNRDLEYETLIKVSWAQVLCGG